MSAVPEVPQSEISVFEIFLSVNFWINFDVGVTVRSVHLMERTHSVENLVQNPSYDRLLRFLSETGVAQGDGLGSSHSAIVAAAIVGPTSSFGIFGGETEEKMCYRQIYIGLDLHLQEIVRVLWWGVSSFKIITKVFFFLEVLHVILYGV